MFGRNGFDRELDEFYDLQNLVGLVAADPRIQAAAKALCLVSTGISYDAEDFDELADVGGCYGVGPEVISAALVHSEPSLESSREA